MTLQYSITDQTEKLKHWTYLWLSVKSACLAYTKPKGQSPTPHNLVWWFTSMILALRNRGKRVRNSGHSQPNNKFKATLEYIIHCLKKKSQRNIYPGLNLHFTLNEPNLSNSMWGVCVCVFIFKCIEPSPGWIMCLRQITPYIFLDYDVWKNRPTRGTSKLYKDANYTPCSE